MTLTPEPVPVPDPATNTTAFLQRLQAALVPATRNASVLPSAHDWRFHLALDRPLARAVDAQATRVLAAADRLFAWAADAGAAPSSAASRSARRHAAASLRPNPLRDASQVSSDQFSATLGNVVDHLLQHADAMLAQHCNLMPEASRSARNGEPLPQFTAAGTSMRNKSMPLPPHVLRAHIDPLPQRLYTESKPDNQSGVPWSRALRFGKPHARDRPADWVPPCPVDAHGAPLPEGRRMGTYTEEDDPRKNPYYFEIITSTPPEHAYVFPAPPAESPSAEEQPQQNDGDAPPAESSSAEEQPRKHVESAPQTPTSEQRAVVPTPLNFDNAGGLAGVPFTWIDSKAGIEVLLAHLSEDRVTEFAVDLEHHSLRTFQGLTCLMQVSTRWHDFIVDTLPDDVRVHAEKLNQVFANPNKVKVLHGADADVLWLQRDLGLYLVGLFDTFHAATRLEFSGRGLAFLLARYVDFEADKRFQLADWRIRPLPIEMLFYARSDTHSLLYVYDRLRAELFAQGGRDAIADVFTRSKSVEAKVYVKPEWTEDGTGPDSWTGFFKRFFSQLLSLPSSQSQGNTSEARAQDAWRALKSMFILRELHRWRDSAARVEDDGTRYVISFPVPSVPKLTRCRFVLAISAMVQLVQTAPTTPPGVTGALSGRTTPLLRKYRNDIASMLEAAVKSWDQAVKTASSLKEGQWPKLSEALRSLREQLNLPIGLTAGIIAEVGEDDLVTPPAPAGGVPVHPLARLLSAAQQADARSQSQPESHTGSVLEDATLAEPKISMGACANIATPLSSPDKAQADVGKAPLEQDVVTATPIVSHITNASKRKMEAISPPATSGAGTVKSKKRRRRSQSELAE